jgi:hypothetical protein
VKKDRRDEEPLVGRPDGAERSDAPRDRVVRHLHRLLGSVAAAGMVAGCDPPPIVCDPLPPPIRCTEDPPSAYLQTHMSVDARWATDDRVDVQLRVDRIGGGSGQLSFLGDPVVTRGGTLLQKERTETSLTFACRADAASDELDVEVPMTCDARQLRPLLSLDVTGARTSGTRVPSQIIVTP